MKVAGATEIDQRLHELVEATLDAVYRADPSMDQRYGQIGRARCREDLLFHYCTLTESIAADDASIFEKYIAWGKLVLSARRIPDADLVLTLRIMIDVCGRTLS